MQTDPYKKNYEIINTYFDMLADGLNDGLFINSKGGLGKTTIILEALKKRNYIRNKHFIFVNSFSTPLAFYNLLEKTTKLKSPRFLICDDIEAILSSNHILGMLRSALWEIDNKRIVNYHSTRAEIPEIDFTGKIIMLFNDFPKDNKILLALKDRIFFHEINMTNDEILQIMRERIVKKPYKELSYKQRSKVLDAVESRIKIDTNLSFRTLIKAYQFYSYAPNHWTSMLDQVMGVSDNPDVFHR